MSWSRKFRLRELARTLEEVRAKGLSAPDALPVEVAALAKFVDEIVGSNPGTGTSTRLVSALGGEANPQVWQFDLLFADLSRQVGGKDVDAARIARAEAGLKRMADSEEIPHFLGLNSFSP